MNANRSSNDFPMRPAVGWIGMGAIGLPMAARAAAAGWPVWGFDPSHQQQEAARRANIHIAANVAEVAAHARGLVVCIVRTLAQVDAVLLGEDGILCGEEPPLAVVMSSVGAVGLAALAERARKSHTRILDAPVLGNAAGAVAGKVTFVVSGPPLDVALARPLLADLAESVVVLGDDIGLAQTVKMVSQVRQIVGLVATIEGVELAVRRGVDERAALGVLAATEPNWATDNWSYARRLWKKRDRSTSLGIFAKDLAAAIFDAEDAGLDVPLTREAHRLIEERLNGGNRPASDA